MLVGMLLRVFSASSAPSPSSVSPPAAPSVSAASIVHAAPAAIRPAPGLARGVWEAPPWTFYAAAIAIVIGAAIYAAVRRRALKRPPR